MPSRRVHDWDAKRRGYSRKVNKVIDLPYAWMGRKHRILFHDPASATAIGRAIDGERGAMGALSHLALDSIKDPQLRAMLELIASMSQGTRRGKIRIVGSG